MGSPACMKRQRHVIITAAELHSAHLAAALHVGDSGNPSFFMHLRRNCHWESYLALHAPRHWPPKVRQSPGIFSVRFRR